MHTVSRAAFPPITSKVVDPILYYAAGRQPYLPFQAIIIARKIAFSIFIAVGQIAPQFKQERLQDTMQNQQQQLDQAWARMGSIDQVSQRLLELETAPFLNDAQLERRLKGQLKTWLVQNEIQNDPGVNTAIQAALARRREREEAGPE